MTIADDEDTASEMSLTLTRIEMGEIDYEAGVKQLLGQVHRLRTIPGKWKDALLEICNDMQILAEDDAVVGSLIERLEKAIIHIQGLA